MACKKPFILNAPWSRLADLEGVLEAKSLHTTDLKEETTKKRDALQNAIDEQVKGRSSPKIEITLFRNWAYTYETLLMLAKPKHRWEVQMVVEAAAALDIKIRGGGAYHTFSPMHPDPGNLMINTCNLQLPDLNYPRYKIDKTKSPYTITMSPGVNSCEIIEDCIKEGVFFTSNVDIPTATYGGIVSGACHGTGLSQKPVSDCLISMKVVNSSGKIQTIPDESLSESEKEEVLRAARVSLGTFGIIVEMTLEIQPLAIVTVDSKFDMTLGDVLEPKKLEGLLRDNFSVHILWVPFNSLPIVKGFEEVVFPNSIDLWNPMKDDTFLHIYNPTKGQPHPKGPSLSDKIGDVLSDVAFAVEGELMSEIPQLTPLMLSAGFKILKHTTPKQQVTEVPFAIFFQDGLDIAHVYDMEFDFPVVDNDFSIVNRALDVYIRLIKKYSNEMKPKFPSNMTFEARFIAKSDSLLCPSSLFPQYTACLEIQSFHKAQQMKEFYIELADEWKEMGGIPHWQKMWAMAPDMHQYLHKRYEEPIKKFLKIRSDLEVDPEDVFVNDALMEVFYGSS